MESASSVTSLVKSINTNRMSTEYQCEINRSSTRSPEGLSHSHESCGKMARLRLVGGAKLARTRTRLIQRGPLNPPNSSHLRYSTRARVTAAGVQRVLREKFLKFARTHAPVHYAVGEAPMTSVGCGYAPATVELVRHTRSFAGRPLSELAVKRCDRG